MSPSRSLASSVVPEELVDALPEPPSLAQVAYAMLVVTPAGARHLNVVSDIGYA